MQKPASRLYSAQQVRALDKTAIEQYGIPGFKLMSLAGLASFNAMLKRWPKAKKLTVFCGAGNNAGDGYIIAGLALKAGWQVQLLALAEPENLKGDALTAAQQFQKANGVITPYAAQLSIEAELIVDALLGTGLDRNVSGLYAQAIDTINQSSAAVCAVDIPSGIHADTGNIMGAAVRADLTVSFIGLKQGLYTGEAPDYCGEIIFDDLNVPEAVYSHISSNKYLIQAPVFDKRSRTAHKGANGHVLIIGGDYGYSGAPRMSAEAALRVGAGLVSVATRPEHAWVMNLNRPEIMCHAVAEPGKLIPLLNKASVVVIGPGLGQSSWAQNLFSAAIETDKPMVVDADGLNLLSQSRHKKNNFILTPHPGEAARLLHISVPDVQHDRYQTVQTIQQKYNGICLLKGAGSLIADAKTIYVNTTGNPGMASGGMGDVLAGIIAGLIAQGMPDKIAVSAAAYIHGKAADLASKAQGERGLLASDLMPLLQKLVN